MMCDTADPPPALPNPSLPSTPKKPANKPREDHPIFQEKDIFCIRRNRLVYRQPRLTYLLHPYTIDLLAKFHTYRQEQHATAKPDDWLASLPAEFDPLIALLVHEKDYDLAYLAIHLQYILYPSELVGICNESADAIIPSLVLRDLIARVTRPTRYGLEPPVPAREPDEPLPPNVQVVLCEATIDKFALPASLNSLLQGRQQARIDAAQRLNQRFLELPIPDQLAVLAASHPRRAPRRHAFELVTETPLPPENVKLDATPRKQATKRPVVDDASTDGALSGPVEGDRHSKKHKGDKELSDSQTRLQGFFAAVGRGEVHKVEPSINAILSDYERAFRPFYLRSTGTLAPTNRFYRPISAAFDQCVLNHVDTSNSVHKDDPNVWRSYFDVGQIRNRIHRYAQSQVKSYASSHDADVQVTTDSSTKVTALPMAVPKRQGVLKLLQFHENIRPPYYGTWSKISRTLNGRRCFHQDKTVLDYDFDSEAEWELDEDGEDLASDDELDGDEDGDGDLPASDAKGPGGDDDEGGWLVPAGYLSDDELHSEDDETIANALPSDRPGATDGPLRKALKPLVPVLVGPTWRDSMAAQLPPPLAWIMTANVRPFHAATWPLPAPAVKPAPRTTTGPTKDTARDKVSASGDAAKSALSKSSNPTDSTETKALTPRRRPQFDESTSLVLGNTVHESNDNLPTMIDRIQQSLPQFSKNQIEQRIKEVATKEKREGCTRPKWYVTDAVLLGRLTPRPPIEAAMAHGTPPGTPERADGTVPLDPCQRTLQSSFKNLLKSMPSK
ncbi:hypothetical protein H4R35_001374 [Dimargaris xerosporica]|nr:hypothetical protein H4R35_001374 [Dimargaris xerosporica]